MKILADYHTHTKYSHGKGTIEENVLRAIELGLSKIGISDHGYKHLLYGVKYKDIFKMKDEIDKLNEKYPQIEILLGMECNVLDDKGNIDTTDEILKVCDYIMAGYHFASTPLDFGGVFNHFNNSMLKSEKAKEYNTNAIINAMKNNDIFVITHPGDKGDVYIEEVAKVAKATNTNLEINNHHKHLSVEQLNKIKDINCTFIVGSDAHTPSDVGKVDCAIEIIKNSGIDINLVKNIRL